MTLIPKISIGTLGFLTRPSMLLAAVLLATCSQVSAQEPVNRSDDSLAGQVEQILVSRCFDCHSGNGAESGFRLDLSREVLLKGGDSEDAAIVPGDTKSGSLLKWIQAKDESERMPPDGEPLTAAEIETIRRWIESGAKVDGPFTKKADLLWSFQPIRKPALPTVDITKSGPLENPIDRFVNGKLQALGLKLNEFEARETLIRRLYLVVLGIPPSPDEVTQFVKDSNPNAYEKLVDRVLTSSAYGERWAQHWLDIIRYGETHGFETNRERPNAWPFRDYVIDSLNEDKSYAQFVEEQIAGDQLGEPVATGYIVAGPHDIVKSPDINLTLMQRQDELADIVNVAGTSFLGLTVGCARCHNHKFDPITQKDFYSMQAIFAGTQHSDRALPPPKDVAQRIADLDNRITELQKSLEPFLDNPRESLIVIDDSQQVSNAGVKGVRFLETPKGNGQNPQGTKRGYRDDPGDVDRAANISGGSYTWWTNVPGKPLATYAPRQLGRYRIWVSWGAGHSTHSPDAVYELDIDGDLETDSDRKEIAVVNQLHLANSSDEKVPGLSLWSGFKDAGIHNLNRQSTIVLRGGKSGTAVTADVVVLEKMEAQSGADRIATKPSIRPAVKPTRNVDIFPTIKARLVRFTIEQSSQSQPCIDELEIFSGADNVALASAGAKASSNGDFVHELHKLDHINDGNHGNSRSWIAKNLTGWVQIEFPNEVEINRVEWGRDRTGRFADRIPVQYRIEVATKIGEWIEVSSSMDRIPFEKATQNAPQYNFTYFNPEKAAQGKSWLKELRALEELKNRISKTEVVYAGTFGTPGPTWRLYRGDPFQKREKVEPNTIMSLGDLNLGIDEQEPKRRLAFAKWLTRKENPLLARVMVNRLWQHTFGTGIVGTPNDFGNSGRRPTHPALLDWLASELVESGWSLKHVQRTILVSRTFRQSSRSNAQGMAKDAGGQFLWRFPPRRLEAESIRDSMLAASGVIDRRIGGPGFSGFEVSLENVRHFFPKKEFGPADWRRMIYMTKVRQERDAVFGAFDCPDSSQVISKRSRSTTPLQSLNLLNSNFVLQQATIMARRLEADRQIKKEPIVDLAYQIAFSRKAAEAEIKDGEDFIEKFGLPAFCRALLNANEFMFIQ